MPRFKQIAALGALVLAGAPSVALAADILDPKFDLGIWTLIVFVLLLLLLRKTAWGPMLEGLRKREEMIRDSVEEAKRTRDEMEQLRLKFHKDMETANAKIPALMDEARANAQRMVEEMRTRANEDIQSEKERARRELEVARDQALQELWTQAAQLATQISAKAIGRSLSEEDHRRLVDEAVREISKN
jgi:F-type H+-transporting ATPase subunit b